MNLFEGCSRTSLNDRLRWLHEPHEWRFGDDGLTIVPHGGTDFFRPYGRDGKDNAALLCTAVSGDFTAVAHAFVHLVGFGDAAAITVRSDASRWAKLCLERSPVGEVAAVSVVTSPWSDDANNELLLSAECFLRLTRKGDTFGMHYSLDGVAWRFVRTFAMELPDPVMVGIHAQAPFGEGCRVRFSSFTIDPEAVKDFRSGE
jgi:regulation of enolase protein 1 (concanavalin A-like superfamily)